MKFGGILSSDAPDPRLELAARLRELPVPVMGLVPQLSLEDTDTLGITDGHDALGLAEMSVDVTYTLWRNPDDRSDPVNLAELNDETRAAVERTTPWPRPRWLVEHIQRMRYPQLWDAVRTTWTRDVTRVTVTDALADHLDEVLTNRYPELAASRRGFERSMSRSAVALSSVGTTIRVSGMEQRAVEFDVHPTLYAVGVQLGPGTAATVVLPRHAVPYVEVSLVARSQSAEDRTDGYG